MNTKSGKRFMITSRETGEDVLGGPVGEGNCYVRAYASPLKGEPAVSALKVGESTRAKFTLSGGRGVYTITRIEDEVTL